MEKLPAKKLRTFFSHIRTTRIHVFAVAIFAIGLLIFGQVFAASGVPQVINFQGRLLDNGGNVLGGPSGTNYCFRFSLYDSAAAGTKLWPSSTPSTMTLPVRDGVFDANIGDTSAGGDALNYNFQDSDSVYVNVEVAQRVAGSCSGVSFETLTPRQRIVSSGYAINSGTIGGFAASQSASGNQVPVLTSGALVLGDALAAVRATTTNALTFQGGGATGNIQFFSGANSLDSSGDLTLAGSLHIGTLNGILKASSGTVSGGATTDDLPEGTTNLYFLPARAVTALTGQNISIFTNDVGYLTSSTGVSSFNTRTGAITLTSADVNGALGYTAGTVSTLSVISTNGFAGTVANATTTPAITLTTTVTGLLKGNGIGISAATGDTDFQLPIALTTTGIAGAATFSVDTLNVPNYTRTAGTGLTLTGASFSVNTSQNIAKLSNLITNGSVQTSAGDGTLSVIANTGTGNNVLASAPTITNPIIANINPGADFTITQNFVVPFTSVSSGAVANTLYLKAGQVGIGQVLPVATLDVNGTALVRSTLSVADTIVKPYSSFGSNVTSHSLSSASDVLVSGNLEVDGNIFADGSSLSFATATTTGDFQVGGNLLASDGTATNPSITFTNDTDTGLFRVGANTFGITTGGVERIRVDSLGNVGIGGASSGAKLDVNGTVNTGALTSTTVNGNTITTGTGTLTLAAGKTFTASNTLTLAGTDGSTLNIGTGGTLGTAAYTSSTAYEVPLTFSTGLTRTTNTITVNTSQNISTLSNLTSNGVVTTSGSTGALSITGVASAATASTLALRDANANSSFNNVLQGYNATVTSGITTTLTVASGYQQYFIGASTQTVVLPVSATMALGQQFAFVNGSAGTITIESSGGNVVTAMASGTFALITAVQTSGTTAASWGVLYMGDEVASGKSLTVSNTLTLAGTDGSTLNIGTGGTLGTAAYTSSTAYEVPLTFSTGLTRTTNTITVNTSQNIAKLSNLTANGFVKTSGSDGTLSIDTSTYLTGNQTITLTGDVSGSGATGITTTIGAGKVTNAMLAGLIAASKLVGTDIATVGTVTTGTWSGLFGAVSGANLTSLTAANISAGTAGINISGNAATVTTDANLTGAITSVGNATLLGSFTSANLATALTDETGSGAAVFGTSPSISGATLTTSSVNGVTLTTVGSANTFLTGTGTYTAPFILLTSGSSGSSTYSAGTLNIPTYTLAGLGGISLTSLSATSPIFYNNTTGVISSQAATTSVNGYLTSPDWNTFNGKQNAISFGTGVQTALGVNVGTAGSPLVNGGVLGTPSSGTVTNLTGTASININGTVGATTPTTAWFTTVTAGTTSGGNTYATANAGTNGVWSSWANTGGNNYIGAENAAATNLITGDTAYDFVMRGNSGLSFSANNGASLHLRIASTGAATFSNTVTAAAFNTSGGYTQTGTSANTFTGTPTFSNATYSALFTGGNVGIGTTSPNAALQVAGNGQFAWLGKLSFEYDNSGSYSRGMQGLSRGLDIFNLENDSNGGIKFTTGTTASPNDVMKISGSGGLSLGSSYVGTDPGAGTMIVQGNVGIGTTSPGALLQVGTRSSAASTNNSIVGTFGAASVGGIAYPLTIANTAGGSVGNESQITFTNASNWAATSAIGSVVTNSATAASDLRFLTYTGSALSESMRIQGTTGNVGIGTTSPGAKLDVEGNGDLIRLRYLSDAGSATLAWANNAGTDLWTMGGGVSAQQDELSIQHQGANVMYFKNNGNVGIGTTSPGGPLEVSGTYYSPPLTNASGVIIDPTLNTTYNNGLNQTGLSVAPTFNTNSSNVANAYGINISPTVTGVYTVTNGYGLAVNAPTLTSGVLTNSYAAVFNGGNVGIGTTSPQNTLQTYGTLKVGGAANQDTGTIALGDDLSTAAYVGMFRGSLAGVIGAGNILNLGGYGGVNINAGNAALGSQSTVLTATTAGNVGIGTTAPDAKLNVAGDLMVGATNKIGFNYAPGNTNFYNYISWDTVGTGALTVAGGLWSGTGTQQAINFKTQAVAAAMSILNNGNVGIGITTPGSSLQVNGGVAIGYSASQAAPTNGLIVSGHLTLEGVTSTGATGTGLLVFGTSPTLTTAVLGSSTATTQTPADNSTKLATTAYVDAAVLGQNFKEAAVVATTANLVGVYASGVFTYTATGTNVIDGVTLAVGNRVLVKNQTTTSQNGIYSVTTAGALGVAGVLTRSSDANTSGQFKTGDSLFILSGTTQSTTTWAYTGADSPVIGTNAITYAQTAGQGSFTAGNGISITGNSIAVDTAVTATTAANLSFFASTTSAQLAGVISDETGTGALVFATSPTLVTPALGTPSALVLTNATGLPAAQVLSGALANGMTATTQTANDNSTKVATTAYVDGKITAGSQATTFTFDGTGTPGTTGSVTITMQRIGNFVTLSIPVVTTTTGTGSVNLTSNTALPAGFRPSTYPNTPVTIIENGGANIINGVGILIITPTGLLIFNRDASGVAFTDNATAGSNAAMVASYYIY